MDRRRQRNEAELQALISELQILKRKLLSKSEALLIISKDLDATQRERDQYKLMAEKLRVRCQAYKRQFSEFPLNRDQASLIQMLRDMKNQKVAHQRQSEILQQKLNEALGDVKLLRERFARQRIGDEGIGPRHFPAHEREELVLQLESAKQQAEQYRMELNSAKDELSEMKMENKEFRQKSERLNNELNFMLNGDKKRIIDIDALCMENKYLQERVKQCQDEKNSLHAQINKLKSALNARKAAHSEIKPGHIRSSGLVISPKQVKEILVNGAGLPSSADTVADLQSIAAALLETINDKNLALHHLRNTNKILGNRVAELERKLRTLEVAGLWNMTGNQRPMSSTPKVKVHVVEDVGNLTPTKEKEDEFMSSLGSRLSRLTDICSKSFKEYKLVSLTPESSGSDSVTPAGDVTPVGDVVGVNGVPNATDAIKITVLNVSSDAHNTSNTHDIATNGDCPLGSDTEITTASNISDKATEMADATGFAIDCHSVMQPCHDATESHDTMTSATNCNNGSSDVEQFSDKEEEIIKTQGDSSHSTMPLKPTNGLDVTSSGTDATHLTSDVTSHENNSNNLTLQSNEKAVLRNVEGHDNAINQL